MNFLPKLGTIAAALLLCGGCVASNSENIRIAWTPMEAINSELPEGIRVHSGADPSIPLRAWYVRIHEADERIRTRVAVAQDVDGLETVSEFALRTGARVAVNAGYYRLHDDGPSHVGLLLIDGIVLEPALTSVLRDERRYYLARAALGLFEDSARVTWVSSRDGVLYEWPQPPQNAPDAPAASLDLEGLEVWPAVDAVAAGPALIVDGEVQISVDAEVFFGSAISDVLPRTAAGVTAEGELVILVVDGRQRESRGVDLTELATLMYDLGCTEALNLDGGGSSTLVVDGMRLNSPAGGDVEREVMSALTILTH